MGQTSRLLPHFPLHDQPQDQHRDGHHDAGHLGEGLPNLVHRVVEDLSEKGIIEEHMKEKILRVLLFRHKHVHPHEKTFKLGLGLRRTLSQRSMQVMMTGNTMHSKTFNMSVWTLEFRRSI